MIIVINYVVVAMIIVINYVVVGFGWVDLE